MRHLVLGALALLLGCSSSSSTRSSAEANGGAAGSKKQTSGHAGDATAGAGGVNAGAGGTAAGAGAAGTGGTSADAGADGGGQAAAAGGLMAGAGGQIDPLAGAGGQDEEFSAAGAPGALCDRSDQSSCGPIDEVHCWTATGTPEGFGRCVRVCDPLNAPADCLCFEFHDPEVINYTDYCCETWMLLDGQYDSEPMCTGIPRTGIDPVGAPCGTYRDGHSCVPGAECWFVTGEGGPACVRPCDLETTTDCERCSRTERPFCCDPDLQNYPSRAAELCD